MAFIGKKKYNESEKQTTNTNNPRFYSLFAVQIRCTQLQGPSLARTKYIGVNGLTPRKKSVYRPVIRCTQLPSLATKKTTRIVYKKGFKS
jgi:hypothetical protein